MLALCVGLAIAFLPSLERIYLTRAADRGEATLRIAVEGLSGTLERFEPLPKLIAERPILTDLLKDPTNQGLLPFVNEQLRLTAMSLGVSDVYLMDIGGTTIAASSYRKERSFVGRNFNFRPYFQQALEGGLGRYFAMGTTSGERGYFFASPVLDNTRIIGVLAVKFDVTIFEEAWSGGTGDILVTDLADVVFLSNRPDWHFRTLGPLSGEAFTRIADTRQYPLDRLVPLETGNATSVEGLEMLVLEGAEYVVNTTALPQIGWTVRHLTPAAPARREALLLMAVAVLAAMLLALGATILFQRRARIRERIEEQAAARVELEHRVAQRTADLNAANDHLTREIEERRATEARLRKTQKDLVQAGKLAALGQMSAALSHELNQPLTAIKSYADNAAAFLDRGRTDTAKDNVGRIRQMADRMAVLSGHLRNFARRPQDTTGPVDLRLVIEDALELMGSRLRTSKARAEVDLPDGPIWVNGGRVRLQQVFVNLVSNALDAMHDQAEPVVVIATEEAPHNRVALSVRDSGTGLSDDILPTLFDPFVTTKAPGHGLGLGLSISYNIVEDFGGRLSATNGPDGGAIFVVELARAEAPGKEVAAE